MKSIKCEMCGSSDLLKKDDIFVCQYCGCKYTKEEAKKLIIDGPIKIDFSDKANDFIELAKEALKTGSDNPSQAYEYACKALEVAPSHPIAWFIKMKSIKYVSNIYNLRIVEIIECGKSAIKYASDEEKYLEKEVYDFYISRAKEILNISYNNICDTANILNLLRQYRNYYPTSPDSYINAYVANDDSNVVATYNMVSNSAVSLLNQIPNESICAYSELVYSIKACSNMYEECTISLKNRMAMYRGKMSPQMDAIRERNSYNLNFKINNLMIMNSNYVNSKKSLNRKKYWDEHQEEHEKLLSEQKELQEKMKKILNEKNNNKLYKEYNDLYNEINRLKMEKKNVSLTKLKERKEIQNQIDAFCEKLAKNQSEIQLLEQKYAVEIEPFQKRSLEISNILLADR